MVGTESPIPFRRIHRCIDGQNRSPTRGEGLFFQTDVGKADRIDCSLWRDSFFFEGKCFLYPFNHYQDRPPGSSASDLLTDPFAVCAVSNLVFAAKAQASYGNVGKNEARHGATFIFGHIVRKKEIPMNTFLSSLLAIAFVLSSMIVLPAQSLQRKGTFGIQMDPAEDGQGIVVVKVFDNTTASALGLQNKDLIQAVNGKAYSDVYDLVDAIGEWRMGDELTLQIKRGKKTRTLNGQIVGKPFETSEHAEVIYGSVPYDGGQLRSILELPHGIDKPPVIFYLPGVGCGTLDFPYQSNSTTKLLVESLVQEGIAVFRVEKPGMGDSQGTKDCDEMDYPYEVAAMEAGLKQLQQQEGIDQEKIFLYGHSLGVITAPIVASRHEVAGIIAWGGISTSWYEYSLKILRDQKVLYGQDYVQVEKNIRKTLPFYYDFYVRQQSPEQLAKNPDYKDLVKQHFHGDLLFGMHHYSYFHTLNEVDLLTAYKDANCPVLALAGKHDVHAVDTDWARDITEAVNYYRPHQGEYAIIPQTTHHYHTTPSVEMYLDMRQNGRLTANYMAQHFNWDIAQIIHKWVERQLDEANG